MKRRLLGPALVWLFALTFAESVPADEVVSASWDFNVYVNDKKVGKHLFSVSETGGMKQVQSEATFNYKIFFIPAYRYAHSATERWTDNCLVRVDASTNANGKRIQVSGEQTDAGFLVEKGGRPVELPECVMTFAYWNPEFLDESRLLNPQTGEYVDVRVEAVGEEVLEVRGQKVTAKRFRLTAYQMDLSLWYSSDNVWLALESVAKGGQTIRYELS
jgi:hypothetical protein